MQLSACVAGGIAACAQNTGARGAAVGHSTQPCTEGLQLMAVAGSLAPCPTAAQGLSPQPSAPRAAADQVLTPMSGGADLLQKHLIAAGCLSDGTSVAAALRSRTSAVTADPLSWLLAGWFLSAAPEMLHSLGGTKVPLAESFFGRAVLAKGMDLLLFGSCDHAWGGSPW